MGRLSEDREQFSAELKKLRIENEKLQSNNRELHESLTLHSSTGHEIVHMRGRLEEQQRRYRVLEDEKCEMEKELTETNELATSAAEQLDILQNEIDKKNCE